MLLENEFAKRIAEQQVMTGLELAFAANRAYDAYDEARRARETKVKDSLHLDRIQYYQVLEETKPVVTAAGLRFEDLAAAAGALIGRSTTLGGDLISIQNGNDPRLNIDGSYRSFEK